MNSVTLTGRVVTDPITEPRTITRVAEFTMDVESLDGRRHDIFHVVVYNELATAVVDRLTPGAIIGVTGWLRSQAIDTDSGSHVRVDVIGIEIDFLGHAAYVDPAVDSHLEMYYEDRYGFDETG